MTRGVQTNEQMNEMNDIKQFDISIIITVYRIPKIEIPTQICIILLMNNIVLLQLIGDWFGVGP